MAHGAWSRTCLPGGTASAAGVSVITGQTVAGPKEEEEEDAESRVTAAEDARGRKDWMTEGPEAMVSNGTLYIDAVSSLKGVGRLQGSQARPVLHHPANSLGNIKCCPPESSSCCRFLLTATLPDIWHESCSQRDALLSRW